MASTLSVPDIPNGSSNGTISVSVSRNMIGQDYDGTSSAVIQLSSSNISCSEEALQPHLLDVDNELPMDQSPAEPSVMSLDNSQAGEKEGYTLHVGNNVGASNDRLAPALVSTSLPLQPTGAPTSFVEDFQPASSSHRVPEDQASKLSCREKDFFSLQEHSPSSESTQYLQKSYNPKICFQNLETDIFNDNFNANDTNNILSSQEFLFSHDNEMDKDEHPQNSKNNNILCNDEPSKHLYVANRMDNLVSSMKNAFDYTRPKVLHSDNNNGIQKPAGTPSKELTTYSKVLAPPNLKPATTGSAPECGVLIERLPGYSLDMYAWAITDVVGKAAITFIGRYPSDEEYILIFLKNPEQALLLVNKGIWFKTKWLNVSFYQLPSIRLTISGVMPFIPDSLIIEACSFFGTSVYPMLRKIPAAVKHPVFKGACSFRREIYIVRNNKDIEIPNKITVNFLGIEYHMDISTTGAKCFNCGSLRHMANRCNVNTNNAERTEPSNDAGTNTNEINPIKPQATQHQSTCQNTEKTAKIILGAAISTTCANSQLTNIKTKDFFSQCNLAELPPIIFKNDNLIKNKGNVQEGTPPGRLKNKLKKTVLTGSTSNTTKESIDNERATRNVHSTYTNFGGNENEDYDSNQKIFLMGSVSTNGATAKKIRRATQSNIEITNATATNNNKNEQVSSIFLFNSPSAELTASKNDEKSDTNMQGNLQSSKHDGKSKTEILEIVEDWCKKSTGLKSFPRKKLTAQFIRAYPDLEDMVTEALTTPKWIQSGSAKFKKLHGLLDEIHVLDGNKKKIKVRKRKQLQQV